jgi:hypothetical protein
LKTIVARAALGALIGKVTAVCGRRRTAPLLRSRGNGRTGGGTEAEGETTFKALRAVVPAPVKIAAASDGVCMPLKKRYLAATLPRTSLGQRY